MSDYVILSVFEFDVLRYIAGGPDVPHRGAAFNMAIETLLAERLIERKDLKVSPGTFFQITDAGRYVLQGDNPELRAAVEAGYASLPDYVAQKKLEQVESGGAAPPVYVERAPDKGPWKIPDAELVARLQTMLDAAQAAARLARARANDLEERARTIEHALKTCKRAGELLLQVAELEGVTNG